MKVEIITCNSKYEKQECVGGYHEIHDISFLQSAEHTIATIESVIKNNQLYGCNDCSLESVIVYCDNDSAVHEINKYYEQHDARVKVFAEFRHMS